uniref:J domain-containing protein n=2 Tax=Strongyloides stercoralis TaxID=6248 RepID=A0A0K0ELN3_STRER
MDHSTKKKIENISFDLYSLFGLPRNCTIPEIRKKFYEESRKHHPDVNTTLGKSNQEYYKKLTFAYSILSSEIQRNYYNSLFKQHGTGSEFEKNGTNSEFKKNDTGSKFEERASLFEKKSMDLHVSLGLAFTGGHKIVEIHGIFKDNNGWLRFEKRKAQITVSKGTRHGDMLYFEGMGGFSPDGRTSIDLEITIHIKEEPGFVLKNDVLYIEKTFQLRFALVGGMAFVTMPDDTLESICVSEVITPGMELRIPFKGMPVRRFNETVRGDLVIKYKNMNNKLNEFLESLSESQKEKFFEAFKNENILQSIENIKRKKYNDGSASENTINVLDKSRLQETNNNSTSVIPETIFSENTQSSLESSTLGLVHEIQETQKLNVSKSKKDHRRISKSTSNFIAFESQCDDDEYVDDIVEPYISRLERSFENTINRVSTIHDVSNVTKDLFLDNLKKFFDAYEPSIIVRNDIVFGLLTERSKNGIWIMNDNQVNYFNPLGRFFTKKRGEGFEVRNRITTYWCKNCRKSTNPTWPYGNALVEVKIKNLSIISALGTHHENCKEISFKHMIANEVFKKSTLLVKNPVMASSTSFSMGETYLRAIGKIFNYGLGELKSFFGEYEKRGHTLRMASYRSAPKLEEGKFPSVCKSVASMEDNKGNLKFHILGEPGDELIVLGTKIGLEIYNKALIRMADGTFFVSPTGYGQLYVVLAVLEELKNNEKRIEYLPVAFGIMKNRTEKLYKQFWDTLIKEMEALGIEHKEPQYFITDKEKAMINVIDKIYPGKHVHCYFHQCQNIVRNLQKIGLIKYLIRLRTGRDNLENLRKFYSLFRKIVSLPMLPNHLIKDQFYRLQEQLHFDCRQWMTTIEFACLRKWTHYLKEEWFDVSENELKKISKFEKSIRNTNGSEAANKKINNHPYAKKHGTCINTLVLCQMIEEDVRLKYFNLQRFRNSETFAFRKRNPKTVEREQKILELQESFRNSGFSNVNTYLEEISNVLMPLKFKETFEEITTIMEIPRELVSGNDEDLEEGTRSLIEEAFSISTEVLLNDIGRGRDLRISTYSGRNIRLNRRYYNSDFVNQ